MQALTLLVHDPDDPVSTATVRLLADWSAAGWIDGLAVVGLAEVVRRGGAVAQNRLQLPPRPGEAPAVRSLGRVVDGRDVRIVVLDPVGPDETWLQARARRHEAGRLLHQHVGRRVGALDLIVTWHNGHWDPASLPWPGWDTLIAAPETSSSPVDPGLALYCDIADPDDVLRVGAHAAAFVSTVCGLWVGVQGSMWDATEDDDDIRMVRTFHMRLDGSDASALLRDAVLAPSALQAAGAIPAKTTAEFAARVDRLGSKLVLERLPPKPPRQVRQDVGARAAIRMFVTFLWRSLVMAPRELAGALVGRGRRGAADRLSAAIFGSSGALQVTVGGVSGRSASAAAVQDVSSSEERLGEALQRLRKEQRDIPPSAPASAQDGFWRLTVDTALALVSGERQHGVEPVEDEGVPRWFTPAQIAPASAVLWRPLHGLGMGEHVPVHDIRACDDALRELAGMAELEGRRRDEVERNRRELEQASQQWRASLMGQIGSRLSTAIGQYRDELTARLDDLAHLTEPESADAVDLAAQLGRSSRATTAVAVLLALILGLLDLLHVVGWPVWVWLPLIVAGWLAGLTWGYLRVQQRIFHLIHRADDQEARSAAIQREIPILVENLRRLRQVYEQYLVWARLLPMFLQEPLGRSHEPDAQIVKLTGQVPTCVVTGHYRVRDERASRVAMAGMVREVRTEASDAWSQFVGASFDRLVAERPEFAAVLQGDVYGLEDQRLALWLDAVRAPGTPDLVMAEDLAEQLSAGQTRAVLARTDPARLQEVLDRCFEPVNPQGQPIHGFAGSAQPAPFRTEAFSLSGLEKRLPVPDPDVPRRNRLAPDGVGATHHILDELASVMVVTRRLGFADLMLASQRERLAAVPPPTAPVRPSGGVSF